MMIQRMMIYETNYSNDVSSYIYLIPYCVDEVAYLEDHIEKYLGSKESKKEND